jgi:hypothetical protein
VGIGGLRVERVVVGDGSEAQDVLGTCADSGKQAEEEHPVDHPIILCPIKSTSLIVSYSQPTIKYAAAWP